MKVYRLDHEHDKREENLLPAVSITFIALAVSGGGFARMRFSWKAACTSKAIGYELI